MLYEKWAFEMRKRCKVKKIKIIKKVGFDFIIFMH